jgi:hypothetical protein
VRTSWPGGGIIFLTATTSGVRSAAQEMGLSVDSFEIGKDGKIVIHTRKGESVSGGNDLDQWMAEKAAKNAHQT